MRRLKHETIRFIFVLPAVGVRTRSRISSKPKIPGGSGGGGSVWQDKLSVSSPLLLEYQTECWPTVRRRNPLSFGSSCRRSQP